MDAPRNHAANCMHEYGVVHRQNIVKKTLARNGFRVAGFRCDCKVPFLIPGTAHRPAHLLLQPTSPPLGSHPDRPTAYDVSVRILYTTAPLRPAACVVNGAPDSVHTTNIRAHERT